MLTILFWVSFKTDHPIIKKNEYLEPILNYNWNFSKAAVVNRAQWITNKWTTDLKIKKKQQNMPNVFVPLPHSWLSKLCSHCHSHFHSFTGINYFKNTTETKNQYTPRKHFARDIYFFLHFFLGREPTSAI